MRKLLSLVLVLAMMACLLPTAVGAAASTSVTVGDATLNESKPYYVNGEASAEAQGHTAHFDAATGKLTLKDAAIQGSVESWGDLEIVLEGADAANYKLGADVVSPTYVVANNDPSNPDTGDAAMPVLWLAAMIMSLMAPAIPAKRRK